MRPHKISVLIYNTQIVNFFKPLGSVETEDILQSLI